MTQQHALFVGIDDYPFAPLTSCANDAVAMLDTLVALEIVERAQCTLMTSPAQPGSAALPTRQAILEWFLDRYDAPPDERLFVFYAGHGLAVRLGRGGDTLRTVLVPAGVRALKNSGGELIDLEELVGRFARRGAREQHWIIDACRNEPDGAVPNVAPIPWDLPLPKDPRETSQMAQAVLYAVAPLGFAQAAAGGHGFLTRCVIEGLTRAGDARWGGAARYEESSGGWVIDLGSLREYADHVITPTKPDWDREDYLTPKAWFGEKKPGPLLGVSSLPDRPFQLLIEPPEARPLVHARLTSRRNPIAQWPPHASGEAVGIPPECYGFAVTLTDATVTVARPGPPRSVDLRLQGDLCLRVERVDPRESVTLAGADVATPRVTETSVRPVLTRSDGRPVPEAMRHARFLKTPEGYDYGPAPASIAVSDVVDPGASVRLTRLSGARAELAAKVGERVAIAEGPWRVEVLLGEEVIAAYVDDFAAGRHYEIRATPQVTPALAALLPGVASAGDTSLMPSETIGRMQGAILSTLLPVIALKIYDGPASVLLTQISGALAMTPIVPSSPAPAVLALALEGALEDGVVRTLAGGARSSFGDRAVEVAWRDRSQRLSVWAMLADRARDGARLEVGGVVYDAPAPRVAGHCTTIAVTAWPTGPSDIAVNLFRMPPGQDAHAPPARLSRAITLATRRFQAGQSMDDVEYDVLQDVPAWMRGDPVLGLVVWFGRVRWLKKQGKAPDTALDERQSAVRAQLRVLVPALPDARVIDALSATSESDRDGLLDAILDEPAFEEPVLAEAVAVLARRALARRDPGHRAVTRFQGLAEDAVFNVVRSSPVRAGRGALS